MAKISVIVPVYNVEAYLKRCVDSILTQNYKDFELILVDDGSPDNCPQICDDYAQKDSRIKVIHQQNGGLSVARNAGIDWVFQNSDSEWFSFIDSDDYIHPRYLEVLLNAAETDGCDVSIGSYVEFSGESVVPEEDIAMPQKIETEKFFMEKNVNAIIAWGKLYRRKCFETIRYPLGKLHEDEFTTYKILFQKENISFIETPLYFYYQNQNSIMHGNSNPKHFDVADALYEQISFFQEKNLIDIYKWSCYHYFSVVTYVMYQLRADWRTREKSLKNQLKEAIKKYGKDGNVSYNSHPGIWFFLYPERRPYYKIRNVLRQLVSIFYSIVINRRNP